MQDGQKNRTLKPHLPGNINAFFGGSHGGSVKWQDTGRMFWERSITFGRSGGGGDGGTGEVGGDSTHIPGMYTHTVVVADQKEEAGAGGGGCLVIDGEPQGQGSGVGITVDAVGLDEWRFNQKPFSYLGNMFSGLDRLVWYFLICFY
jgi:hypothetical protein